jgi:AcrR family transcriptional regulator
MDVEHLLPVRAPRQRARQSRAIEKIDALVEATVRVLETEGEAGVRVADICDQVGVSYGSVYHHFGDREGLIRAAQFARLQAQPGQDIASFASALDGDTSRFVDSLMDICRSIASAERGPVREVRTSVLASTHGRPELRGPVDELETKVMDDLEAVVIQAQELGIADPAVDARALAAYLAAVSYGLVLLEHVERRPSEDDLASVILRGFAAFMPT